MASYKKAEDDVYSYLTKKWRIGWSLGTVSEFYNNLSYRQVIDESADMSKFFDVAIRLDSQMEMELNKAPKFSVRGLAENLYKARGALEERLRELPESPEAESTLYIDLKSLIEDNHTYSLVGANMGNNHPLIFDDEPEDDFLDNLGSNKMEAGE